MSKQSGPPACRGCRGRLTSGWRTMDWSRMVSSDEELSPSREPLALPAVRHFQTAPSVHLPPQVATPLARPARRRDGKIAVARPHEPVELRSAEGATPPAARVEGAVGHSRPAVFRPRARAGPPASPCAHGKARPRRSASGSDPRFPRVLGSLTAGPPSTGLRSGRKGSGSP
jgi:hypothetical protein